LKIGITYDLRSDYLSEGYGEEETAEFDRPETIDAIDGALRALGYRTERIGHIRHLVEQLASGERWHLVFNIAEGLRGFGREAQIPALLDAYDIPYTFSDPLSSSLTLHKGMAKRVFRDLGIPTPDFVVVESESDLAEAARLPLPLFAKPVAEGTGKGIDAASKITSLPQLSRICRQLLHQYRQPVLVERFLPGREFTMGIVGTGDDAEAIGMIEVHLKDGAERDVYSYVNKERCEDLVEYRLVKGEILQQASRTALAAWKGLGCRDAGRIDLRADERNVLNVLEINPLAGIHPQHSDLPIICNLQGIPYRNLIQRIMESATKRISGHPRRKG